jgi:hypothetical protein
MGNSFTTQPMLDPTGHITVQEDSELTIIFSTRIVTQVKEGPPTGTPERGVIIADIAVGILDVIGGGVQEGKNPENLLLAHF